MPLQIIIIKDDPHYDFEFFLNPHEKLAPLISSNPRSKNVFFSAELHSTCELLYTIKRTLHTLPVHNKDLLRVVNSGLSYCNGVNLSLFTAPIFLLKKILFFALFFASEQ